MVNQMVGFVWAPHIWMHLGGSFATGNMIHNSAGDEQFVAFVAPKTGTIDRIAFDIQSRTGSVTLDLQIQGLTTLGAPDGVNVGSGTHVASATGHQVVTLSSTASVTAGNTYVIRIAYSSGATSATLRVAAGTSVGASPYFHPYVSPAQDTTGTDATATYNWPTFTALYTDGEAVLPAIANSTTGTVAFNSASTPDEYGNKFTCPVDGYISGATFLGIGTAGGVITIKLYDSNSNLLTSTTAYGDWQVTSRQMWNVYFPLSIPVSKGNTYRITMVPDANNLSVLEYGFVNATTYDVAFLGGLGLISKTTRTDAGAWTDTAGTIELIGPIFNNLNIGPGRPLIGDILELDMNEVPGTIAMMNRHPWSSRRG